MYTLPLYLRALIATASLAVLAAGAWWSVQLARADAAFRQSTPSSVDQARRLTPGNLEYDLFSALQTEYEGGDPVPLLERIAAEHSHAAAPRIRLGLAAEIAGDTETAERWLLEAYAVDRTFEPRWTLANFYARQNDLESFWQWIHAALGMSYGNRTPAFDLAWRMSNDPDEILTRAIPSVPTAVAADYIWYLLSTENIPVAAIGDAALRLASATGAEHRSPLLAAIDRLLTSDEPQRAAAIWQAMGFPEPDGLLYSRFHPANADPYLGQGFDWRYIEGEGIRHLDLDAGGHRITLTGDQSEQATLLLQIVGGLQPGAMYQLVWNGLVADIDNPTGLSWQAGDRSVAVEAGTPGPAGLSADASGELTFTASGTFEAVVLGYRRPLGQPRARGDLEIAEVTLERIP